LEVVAVAVLTQEELLELEGLVEAVMVLLTPHSRQQMELPILVAVVVEWVVILQDLGKEVQVDLVSLFWRTQLRGIQLRSVVSLVRP
jgi:hypothetical protein